MMEMKRMLIGDEEEEIDNKMVERYVVGCSEGTQNEQLAEIGAQAEDKKGIDGDEEDADKRRR